MQTSFVIIVLALFLSDIEVSWLIQKQQTTFCSERKDFFSAFSNVTLGIDL